MTEVVAGSLLAAVFVLSTGVIAIRIVGPMAVPGWLLGVITWASAGHPISAGRSWLEVLVFAVFSLGIIGAGLDIALDVSSMWPL